MKFVIKQEILLESLNHTSRAISPRNLIPILTGIKFDLKEEGLFLSASDTDISIRCLIPNDKIEEISELGSVVIGGKYIVEIIKKLPNVDITIEVIDGYKMIVSTTNTEFSLNGINPNEFPNLDLDTTKEPIIINTNLFKKVINQTFFATSQNESRPLLTGINFRIEDNKMEVMATDSYRLSRKIVELDKHFDNPINIVIPGKNLLELSKIMDDDKDNLELHLFDNKILFKYKNILFLSRLLSGTYPATSSIIPDNFSVSVECSCISLFEMIDRASLLTSDRDKNTIKLQLSKKELVISSNSPEIGKVEEKMKVKSSDEISISFSSKYMLDAVRSFETENITLYMNSDSSPIIIKSSKDDSLIQLVLPIKTY
ncbi:MAG: DNA polymerase III subunit beta [Bacilli bacterium]|nr:DNA polymerase III subunit beta [Bacilli bacterium]